MKTICSKLIEAKGRASIHKAAKFKVKRKWQGFNWSEHFENCANFGCALLESQISKGDTVAILAGTRYEWSVADLGTMCVGAVTVPVYQSNRPEEISYILKNAETKVLVCEDESQFKKWRTIARDCPSVELVVVMTAEESHTPDYISWQDFLNKGKSRRKKSPNEFEKLCNEITLDTMATIVYTSGTTGNPKGVVHNHEQISSEVIETFANLNVDENDCTLTFLPFAHVVGRMEMWGSVFNGYTLAYAESIEKIKFNLAEVRPTLMIAVPRIFEKIYNGILSQVETSKVKSQLFKWALDVGKQVSRAKRLKQTIPLHLLGQYKLAQKLVFNKIIEKMGGRLRFAFSGGAPLSKQIGEFFHAAGLIILEGYGLTETCAAITMNTPLNYEFGTVGRPIGDVEIKIADDGEILVKSKKVMQGYFKLPEATKEVFSGDFFHTGDIGEFNEDGFLRITDRKKDLIKTAGGKYVAPQKLENLLKLNQYVSNVLIHGDQRKYIVALLTLDEEAVRKLAKERNLSFSNISDLSQSSEVRNVVQEAVAETNSQLASYETIKNFAILPHDFTVETGELTPSLKVKRKFCDQKFASELDRLYGIDKSSL